MPELTDAEIADYRDITGDFNTPYFITNERIQGFYDTAVALGEDADTTQAITVVQYLRRLLGRASVRVDNVGEIQRELRSQWFKHIKETLLPHWENLAGMGGEGFLSTGGLNLNIAADPNDLEYDV